MDLHGRVAVVTGGTGAIGREIVDALAGEGVCVSAWDLDSESSGAIKCDVSDETSVQAAFDATIDNLGLPTILINAAGVSGGRAPRAYSAGPADWDSVLSPNDAWRQVFEVNVLGVVNTSRAFARLIAATDYRGAIINISSVAGNTLHNGELAAYSASKAAINKLTRIAAIDFGPLGIRVNAVAPGTMENRMKSTGASAVDPTLPRQSDPNTIARSSAMTPVERRPGRAYDIAQAVLSLLATDFVTGEVLTVDGGQMLQRGASADPQLPPGA